MKILKTHQHKTIINSATSAGTVYYQTELSDAIDALESADGNVFVINELQKHGWKAIDLKHNLFGSAVIDDKLYICNTDGKDILVEDGTLADPENALFEYDTDMLSAYIKLATPDVITKSITGYEVNISDIDSSALDLLKQGVSFVDLIKAAEDLNLTD